MQTIIKNLIILTWLCLLASCSKDFLDENLSQDALPLGLSNIYVSPEWESSAYVFRLPSIIEVDYEIVSKPSWLKLGSQNGHLSDSIAIVECSATSNSAFSSVGIYLDFMTVKAGEKNYKVPVGYITEGNPTLHVQSDLSLSYSAYDYPVLPVQNTGEGILIWEITSMPDWLVLDKARLESEGIFITPHDSYGIPLQLKINEVHSWNLAGTIVLSTNDKMHPTATINVTANLGTPQLNLYTSVINFSYAETSKTLSFSNGGNGMLVWEFTDIPEWLTITPSRGIYNAYSGLGNIIFNCDISKLAPGQNSATIILKTNDPSHLYYSIRVTAFAPGIKENMRTFEGNLVDALFNKNTNILYYITSTPNKLIAYDVIGKTVLNEIALSKAPTCLAISEDWLKGTVGHNGYISVIDLTNNTVAETYTIDYSVNDIAWAEDDWFCYTENSGSFSKLHWINTDDGTMYEDNSDSYSLDGKTIIKKVPYQPYLIATRNGTSPSGFFAYDIASKSKKSYAHMDLTNFWFSENGDYIFARDLNVYRTTSSTESTDVFNADIRAIGKIDTEDESYYGINFLDCSDSYLWVIKDDSYSSETSAIIYQIENNDYTLVKKYYYDLLYQPDGNTAPFNLSAKFAFVNNEGTQIAVLCKGVNNNSWVIQFVTIE